MLPKKARTIDEYKTAGAMMRLYKTLGSKTCVAVSGVLSAADTDKLLRALSKIDEVCSKAEDNMFRDFPNLGDEYTDVFYGSTENQPRGSLDAEMIARARKAAEELFEREND